MPGFPEVTRGWAIKKNDRAAVCRPVIGICSERFRAGCQVPQVEYLNSGIAFS